MRKTNRGGVHKSEQDYRRIRKNKYHEFYIDEYNDLEYDKNGILKEIKKNGKTILKRN